MVLQKILAIILFATLPFGFAACAKQAKYEDASEEADMDYYEEEVVIEDPLEPMNRKLFALHNWIDERFFRPFAVVYRAIVPPPGRKAVGNFFSNVDHIPITVNNILQLRPKAALNSGSRLVINTTVGIGGLFDPATPLGFEYRKSDLGQTLARWGWENSTYIFVPLFGPTTTRDGIGVVADLYMTPWPYLHDSVEWGSAALFAINQRSKFIETEGLLAVAALDQYSFIRDGYLISREAFITGAADGEKGEEGNFGDIL
ncbi:MAG: VacJ family lipoprotein [Gammaproteobacteria bacterium]